MSLIPHYMLVIVMSDKTFVEIVFQKAAAPTAAFLCAILKVYRIVFC